jgi:hypothetical protein
MGVRRIGWKFVFASLLLATATLASSPAASAQNNSCGPLRVAWQASGNFKTKVLNQSGIDAEGAITTIVNGDYTEKCKFLRDDSVNAEAAAVHQRRYESKIGNVDELMWISKKSGKILRSDFDADMGAKGKGHKTLLVIP